MLHIGVCGLSASKDVAFWAAFACSDPTQKMVVFARGSSMGKLPGSVTANGKQTEFPMELVNNMSERGVYAFTQHCSGYVLIADSESDTPKKLETLLTDILTFENKTLESLPIVVVWTGNGDSTAVEKYAASKHLPFYNTLIEYRISLLNQKLDRPIQTGPDTEALKTLIEKIPAV